MTGLPICVPFPSYACRRTYGFMASGPYVTTPGSGTPKKTASTGNIQVFYNSGTYVPSEGLTFCIVECVGGGGGGGGSLGTTGTAGTTSASGWLCAGGGGASGGYSRSMLSSAQVLSVSGGVPVVIGVGGTGGTTTPTAGGPGGTSAFGTFVISNGGGGGSAFDGPNMSPDTQGRGGIRGAPGTGQFVSQGCGGGMGGADYFESIVSTGQQNPQALTYSGMGGPSFFGGPDSAFSQIFSGETGTSGALGSGGNGGLSGANGPDPAAGGQGGGGVIIVTEFCFS